MFIVLTCMLAGIALGYLLRKRKFNFMNGLILTLIWLLLFLLGMEVGANKVVVNQFAKLGVEALLLAFGGVLGSVLAAWLLWVMVRAKFQAK